MPHSPSSRKRVRQTKKRTEANRTLRSAYRTVTRRLLALVEAGDREAARALLPTAYQRLDKAARQRVLHPNTAANHKRRLARKVGALG
jgi:small subunit ribosomal protein S20